MIPAARLSSSSTLLHVEGSRRPKPRPRMRGSGPGTGCVTPNSETPNEELTNSLFPSQTGRRAMRSASSVLLVSSIDGIRGSTWRLAARRARVYPHCAPGGHTPNAPQSHWPERVTCALIGPASLRRAEGNRRQKSREPAVLSARPNPEGPKRRRTQCQSGSSLSEDVGRGQTGHLFLLQSSR